MSKTMADMIAESEIKDVHIRYCRANDRRDEELMRSCLHPDAIIELHEEFDVDAFVAMGRSILGRYSVTWHNTGNQLVEVQGDRAWAEHYTISAHRMPADANAPERDFIAYGRYVDRMERRDGEWRIARRKMIVDYTRMDRVSPGTPDMRSGGGTRDRSDPSYSLRLSA